MPTPTDPILTLADIERAAGVIGSSVVRSPLLASPSLSALTGAEVYVKYENMQPTGSFKERGALVKLSSLTPEERQRGVIAMSAGNHAQAVAYHAKRLGIPATIVMPQATPLVKVENTRAHGAHVVLDGETLSESAIRAEAIALAENLAFIHPYDDNAIMAGQGTVGLEILADNPDLEVLVIPIGGGGLFAGIATAARALKPEIELIGVEAALYPSFSNALSGRESPLGGPTIAEGIAVKNVGKLTLPVVRQLASEVLVVDEEALESAVNAYATLQRSMAEGAGAAALAALLAFPERFKGRKVGLVLSGGNIDARLLASVMVRALERADRIVSFRVITNDGPGLLGRIASRLGELGANILEVSHGRLFLDVPAKGVSIDLTIETRDAEHSRHILSALAADGLAPTRVDARSRAEQGH
ncbi:MULTISPECIES: threonine ammonia-lyase [unclassified Chelatococcus]|uniref:threonine ammonia-lyase n=1 Tax=unclassified Chelatococcus TaxID=2638111 RepID=UPI0025C1C54F|nr:threonine ammonia-lyase [Chelatococcus sp.]